MRELRESVRDLTPREAYAESLEDAGLGGTALVTAWQTAAAEVLTASAPAELPLAEAGYLPADEAVAYGWRVSLRRGQRLDIDLELVGAPPPRVFLELFRIDSGRPPERVTGLDEGELALSYEARRDGEYLLRLQPELLRAGRFMLRARSAPSLAFPVSGRDERAVKSRFGAPRDGGRRSHHGIDIFAPRGTPVVAAADGFVRRVGESRLGGKVVWLSDTERGQSLYYAHLDRQAVSVGQLVSRGDTLGFVGNTGNARTTAPHLHFGIYRRGEGPIDPYYFVYLPRGTAARIAADTSRLGDWVRVRAPRALLRPGATADDEGEALPAGTVLRVRGATGERYRVSLPDGRDGYIVARAVEETAVPSRQARVEAALAARDQPGIAD